MTADGARRGLRKAADVNTGLTLATALGFTSGAGLLMLLAGTRKRMLVWRAPRGRCFSCGRKAHFGPCRR